MIYKEHQIFVAIRRDAGGCFWLPLANVCWSEGERKTWSRLKVVPKTTFCIPPRLRLPLSR